MVTLDPQAILSGGTRRGVSSGVIVAITLSSLGLALFLGTSLWVGGMSIMVVATVCLITLVPLMVFVLALDSLEPQPRHLLAATFLWGAGAATVLSAGFEMVGGVTLGALGPGGFTGLAVIIAPVVEESLKGLAVFAVFWFRRHQIQSLTTGVVYAATSAIGFAAAEDMGYYVLAAHQGGGGALAATFLLRGVMSPFCHPVFTAVTGIAVAWAVRARGVARGLRPLGGLLVAMLLHGLWNGLALSSLAGLLVALVIVGGALAAILIALRHDRRRTLAQIGSCLTAYVPTGLVTATDLAMLATMAARRRARAWARWTHGETGFRAMRDYQLACAKLTRLHDRASAGVIDVGEFERQRRPLLTLMRFAREAFLGPPQVAVPLVSAPWYQPYAPPQSGPAPRYFPQQQYFPSAQGNFPPPYVPPQHYFPPQSVPPQHYFPPQSVPPQGYFPAQSVPPQGYCPPQYVPYPHCVPQPSGLSR